MIYHIASREAWLAAQENGAYEAESLRSEGFIHCSTRSQLLGVANSLYSGQRDLVALCIDESKLDVDLVWEAPAHPPGRQKPAVGDETLFPHIYGSIALGAVVKAVALDEGEAGFELPPELAS